MNYWLVKSEPFTYSWEQLLKDKRLQNIALIRQARLSVMPLTKEEFALIVAKGQ